MKHYLRCDGRTTYTVVDLQDGRNVTRQCDNCGAFDIQPIPQDLKVFQVVALSASGKPIRCTTRTFKSWDHVLLHTRRSDDSFFYDYTLMCWHAPGWRVTEVKRKSP